MTTAPSDVRVAGPLVPYVDGFCSELAERGYTPLSAANQVRVLAHLSRWLTAERIEVGELTPQRVEAFLQARRAQGYTSWLSPRGLGPLLDYLRRIGAAPQPPQPVPDSPVERLLAAYRDYLTQERGLAASTVGAYEGVARLFLSQRPGSNELGVEHLAASDVVSFVLERCRQSSPGSAKYAVTALRCLLRFLHVAGWTAQQLADAVPAVAGGRAGLPKALDAGQVTALLASCDRDSAVGLRDYAILVLLARLGRAPARRPACAWTTSTGRQDRSRSRAKGGDRSDCPFRPTSERRWLPTYAAAVPASVIARCSSALALPTARSAPMASRRRSAAPATGPGCPRWARTDCATPRPHRCCAPAPR